MIYEATIHTYIFPENAGQTDGQTDRQTERQYTVSLHARVIEQEKYIHRMKEPSRYPLLTYTWEGSSSTPHLIFI